MPINNHKLLLTLKIRHEIGTRKVVQGKNGFGFHFSECNCKTAHCLFITLYICPYSHKIWKMPSWLFNSCGLHNFGIQHSFTFLSPFS